MENSGIVFQKAIVFTDDHIEKCLILGQVGQSSDEPAVGKFALSYIESRCSFDEKPWISTNFTGTKPFMAAGALKLWIFKQNFWAKTSLTKLVEVLLVDALLSSELKISNIIREQISTGSLPEWFAAQQKRIF